MVTNRLEIGIDWPLCYNYCHLPERAGCETTGNNQFHALRQAVDVVPCGGGGSRLWGFFGASADDDHGGGGAAGADTDTDIDSFGVRPPPRRFRSAAASLVEPLT